MPKTCSLKAINKWTKSNLFAKSIIESLFKESPHLSPKDRSLSMELFYGVVRNLSLLDIIIKKFRSKKISLHSKNILRLGLYQIFFTRIKDYAIVNSTVELSLNYEKKLINAILRESIRKREEINSFIKTLPPEQRFSHPKFLFEKWKHQYGELNATELCKWNNTIPKSYARINSIIKSTLVNDTKNNDFDLSLSEKHPNFFEFKKEPNLNWIKKGLIYIQDPSTSLSCYLLNPKPNETILDACAAPGGKTSLLASLMNNRGNLFITDNSESRLKILKNNLSNLKVYYSKILNIDWSNPKEKDLNSLPKFDAILLDAPCSNTGVINRRVDVRWKITNSTLINHVILQKKMIDNLKKLLKPSGRLVYSTCSIEKEENQDVISESSMIIEKKIFSLPWIHKIDGSFSALLRNP